MRCGVQHQPRQLLPLPWCSPGNAESCKFANGRVERAEDAAGTWGCSGGSPQRRWGTGRKAKGKKREAGLLTLRVCR